MGGSVAVHSSVRSNNIQVLLGTNSNDVNNTLSMRESLPSPSTTPFQLAINEDDSKNHNASCQKIDMFISRYLTLGNKYDAISFVTSNKRSHNHFVIFLRKEFDNTKLEFESWQVDDNFSDPP
jgi:hypothetical protein